MIVVVMGLSEDAKRGMKFPNELERPNLIHPKVIERGGHSD